MRYLLILILTLTLTGEVMGGAKKKKKLEKKWKPVVFDTTPVYTEPPKKSIQIGGITIGGKFGKTPDFNALKKLFKQ